MPPAAAPPRLGRCRIVEITGEKASSGIFARQSNDELALGTGSHLAVVLIDHSRLKGGDRTPDCSDSDRARLVIISRPPSDLAHTPDFEMRDSEAFLEFPMDGGLHSRPKAKSHAVRPLTC